jgi:hypothetical protein
VSTRSTRIPSAKETDSSAKEASGGDRLLVLEHLDAGEPRRVVDADVTYSQPVLRAEWSELP